MFYNLKEAVQKALDSLLYDNKFQTPKYKKIIVILSKILTAREKRREYKATLAKQNKATISINFNIPGYPKSSKNINIALNFIISDFENFLQARRIKFYFESKTEDEAGSYILWSIDNNELATIKQYCEQYENSHFLGRILDVDVFDNKLNPISSKKKKKCFICNNTAIVCMRSKTHSFEELREHVFKLIDSFVLQSKQDIFSNNLITNINKSILYEVALEPKPGLVTPSSSGVHTDMDYFSFLNSTSALMPYWQKIIKLAFSNNSKEISKTDELFLLREIGIDMEKNMLKNTNGVNTHRGAIFLIGSTAYAISCLKAKKIKICAENIKLELIRLHKYNDNNLLTTNKELTHGSIVINKYGKEIGGGARMQLAKGLPIVFEHALPFLLNQEKKHPCFLDNNKYRTEILQKCLSLIISKNYDTNILFRSDIKKMLYFQQLAANVLKNNTNFVDDFLLLIDFCKKNKISPGGSADLLAVSILIFNTLK